MAQPQASLQAADFGAGEGQDSKNFWALALGSAASTLPPTTQTLLASLTALAQFWAQDRRAASVVRRAQASSDDDVRQAVTVQ